ncbi:hypothetical protein NXZ84_13025 [Mechercharimyces sp. CAU 1602]|nr:hypothetical protein [Mechercharimyces sp. CAU 1602]
MSNFTPPEHVQTIVDKYKQQSTEKVGVFPAKIIYNGGGYYLASYNISTSLYYYLIISESGEVPLKEEVEDISLIVLDMISFKVNLRRYGKSLVGERRIGVMKFSLKVLQKVYKELKEELPASTNESFQRFIEVPVITLDKYRLAKENLKAANEIIQHVLSRQVVDVVERDKIDQYIFNLGKYAYQQNEIQMKTYRDRKRVITYLLKKGKWWWAFCLWIFHLWLHPEKVKPKDRRSYLSARAQYIDEIEPEHNVKARQRVISRIRNPVSEGDRL